MSSNSLEQLFPNLAVVGYLETSKATSNYNCLAWAGGVQDAWWDPEIGYWWPSGLLRDYSLETVRKLYEELGYTACKDGSLEPGYEKVVIYGQGGIYEHAARQLPNGAWASKIGHMEDIEHATPEALIGKEYGVIAYFLRRKRNA